ncbi:hypothetical protein Tco_0345595 [Tanacetum coccineum]
MDLKTQLETVAKNHQASIQNLETKFDRLVDKQSGRPSGSLLSNTHPNQRAYYKAYQPPQSSMSIVNAAFTRQRWQIHLSCKKIILEMEEDSKVPLILGQPFLYTADANDDTCFNIDVIDEILEEDFDALLDEGSKILHSIEGTLLEEEIFAEFDEFIAMTADENLT